MARYVVTVSSARTPQAAFAYMADLRNFAEWDPGVARVTQIDGSGGGPDASFDVVVISGRREMTLRYVTMQYEDPRLVVIEARSRMLTSIDRIAIAASGIGCLVTYDAELTFNGPLRYVDFVLKPMFKRIGDRAARGLVRALAGEIVAR
ncbi:MAG TPA: SRPBCC family protein [Ilumatobacteraceae bacterium]